jgi:hypothetical protein
MFRRFEVEVVYYFVHRIQYFINNRRRINMRVKVVFIGALLTLTAFFATGC